MILRAFHNNGLIFYNSSPVAGASQHHKHIQVLPISSLPGKKIPINERVMEALNRARRESRELFPS